MTYRVEMTARAERDAAAAMDWLSKRSQLAAARWHRRLLQAISSLESHPSRCGLAPEADDLRIELRQLLFGKRRGKYRILFIVKGNTIQVLHIRHSAQDLLKRGEL